MTLRVQDDPDEDRRYIAAYIQTGLKPTEAIDQLHGLIEDWWLNVSGGLLEEAQQSLD